MHSDASRRGLMLLSTRSHVSRVRERSRHTRKNSLVGAQVWLKLTRVRAYVTSRPYEMILLRMQVKTEIFLELPNQ
jgi:hypothetical protein